jgi:hypothetical protein
VWFLLEALADEIREAGKNVFRNNKNRLKGYSSSYWKKQNRKKKVGNRAKPGKYFNQQIHFL